MQQLPQMEKSIKLIITIVMPFTNNKEAAA
jgi:hypothetical protein